MLGELPLEEQMAVRLTYFEFAPGVELRTCSVEDLEIMMLFVSRPLDLRDAEGVAIRHDQELDWIYVHSCPKQV